MMAFIGVLAAFIISVVTCALIVLKLLGYICCDWVWVFSPTWVSIIFAILWTFECIAASFIIRGIRFVSSSAEE